MACIIYVPFPLSPSFFCSLGMLAIRSLAITYPRVNLCLTCVWLILHTHTFTQRTYPLLTSRSYRCYKVFWRGTHSKWCSDINFSHLSKYKCLVVLCVASRCATWMPFNKQICCGGSDGFLRFYDIATPKAVRHSAHTPPRIMHDLVVRRSGRRIVKSMCTHLSCAYLAETH